MRVAALAVSALLLLVEGRAGSQMAFIGRPEQTPSGAHFTLPTAWTAQTSGATIVASPPEPDSHLAIVDVGAARDASDAVAAAWRLYRPGQSRKVKVITPGAPRDGWEERDHFDYEVAADEKVQVSADAFRKGAAWTVLIVDASQATGEKRLAAISLVARSIRPAGYVRETFAGKAAHRLDPARVELLRSFVQTSARSLGVPGVGLALIDHGRVVYEGGLGVRELGRPEAVDAHTLFQIASNTKGLTTLLLAREVDAGRIRWDQPAAEVFSGFRLGSAEATGKVLMRHLVCACTGMPRRDYEWIFGATRTTPASTTFDVLADTKPTSGFGEVFQYSNAMVAAAGYIGGHVLHPEMEPGAAYDRAMQTEIFDPLGMGETTFSIEQALAGNHASPHFSDGAFEPVRSDIRMDHGIIAYRPAGGAWSTAHDMIKYVQLELARGVLPDGTRLISEKNLLERRAPSVPVGEDAYYGMGLMVDATWGVQVVHHGGTMPGYASDAIFVPDADVGVVILTNSDEGQLLARPLMRRLLEVLYDGRPEAAGDVESVASRVKAQLAAERARLVVPPDPEQVAKLARRYENPALGLVSVSSAKGMTRFDFNAWGSEVASRMDDDGTISFVPLTPPGVGYEFIAGRRDGRRTLTLRDGQHEYVFTEKT